MNGSPLALSLAAGALTTLSPCVFPLLPLVLGGALQRHHAAPLAMGAGMALAFALVGVVVGGLGASLGVQPETVRRAGAILLLVFGAAMIVPALEARVSAAMTPLASSAHAVSARLDAGSPWGAFGIGALLGLVWSPCAGPLLGSTLALVASAGGAARGALLLGLFGLGAALPLVLVAYASRARLGPLRAWVLAHGARARRWMGGLLVAVGVLILTGGDRWLETQVNDALPEAWIALTTRI